MVTLYMDDNFRTSYINRRLILLISILCFLTVPVFGDIGVRGQDVQVVDFSQNRADIRTDDEGLKLDYFFDDTCGSCKKVSPFIEKISEKYPDVSIIYHNMNRSEPDSHQSRHLFNRFKLEYGLNEAYIPIIFFNGTAIQSDEKILNELEPAILARLPTVQPDENPTIISYLKDLLKSLLNG